jgi:hypothetical protein
MNRIMTASPERARGLHRLLFSYARRQYGGVVPGIAQIFAVDLRLARPVMKLYDYLHLRKSSPLNRLQREMIATVVNGIIGGAP